MHEYPLTLDEHALVLLGNVGEPPHKGYKPHMRPGEETTKHIQTVGLEGTSNSHTHIYGIDCRRWNPGNGSVTQIAATFMHGLEQFVDESIAEIHSDMTIGFYDRRGRRYDWKEPHLARSYHQELFSLAYQKLKPNGQFYISVIDIHLEEIANLLGEAEFDVTTREFHELEYYRSMWTRYFRLAENRTIHQITATKTLNKQPDSQK